MATNCKGFYFFTLALAGNLFVFRCATLLLLLFLVFFSNGVGNLFNKDKGYGDKRKRISPDEWPIHEH